MKPKRRTRSETSRMSLWPSLSEAGGTNKKKRNSIYNSSNSLQDTLRECESKPVKGEVKFCATSLDSMLDFTHSILRKDSGFEYTLDFSQD
ncbi:hypothetical protein Ahy_B03g068127 [Arachis hypogaea]|uniref:BURP domain-containing protein n=1 Tax=Arachis hypogaea TaxID=3818 RepID=A0A445A8Q9_ARAHY|nr:hypothetical protein Ahy_B03g068127 [Arachis hypogaea]